MLLEQDTKCSSAHLQNEGLIHFLPGLWFEFVSEKEWMVFQQMKFLHHEDLGQRHHGDGIDLEPSAFPFRQGLPGTLVNPLGLVSFNPQEFNKKSKLLVIPL